MGHKESNQTNKVLRVNKLQAMICHITNNTLCLVDRVHSSTIKPCCFYPLSSEPKSDQGLKGSVCHFITILYPVIELKLVPLVE